ncbi:MAG: DUF2480 family protein [Bacteroidota bacterium]
MDEIVNRVANSKLQVIDLEEMYPDGARMALDISQWLYEGIILREKEFRTHLETFDWSVFRNAYVAIHCSTDAIVPAWAYMLVSVHLNRESQMSVVGSLEELETLVFSEMISNLDITSYQDMPVIVKGCANKPIPENAYLLLARKLQPVAKSIMYGEACSSVPLYKKKK